MFDFSFRFKVIIISLHGQEGCLALFPPTPFSWHPTRILVSRRFFTAGLQLGIVPLIFFIIVWPSPTPSSLLLLLPRHHKHIIIILCWWRRLWELVYQTFWTGQFGSFCSLMVVAWWRHTKMNSRALWPFCILSSGTENGHYPGQSRALKSVLLLVWAQTWCVEYDVMFDAFRIYPLRLFSLWMCRLSCFSFLLKQQLKINVPYFSHFAFLVSDLWWIWEMQ